MSHLNDDAMEAVLPVAAAFRQLGVPFYVGGSLASSAFGAGRSTADADLIADLQLAHAAPLVRALGDQYYADEDSIRRAIQHRQSFNLIYNRLAYKVDVFVVKARALDQVALRRAGLARLAADDPASALPFATPEDIILAKLEWYRLGNETSERQWSDVRRVMQVQGSALDQVYLDRWAAEVGVADLLQRVRADVNR